MTPGKPLKQQFLDVVILRKQPGEFEGPLPDGLDNLAEHNLLGYKSLREALDDWALDELIGHYVNYQETTRPGDHEITRRERPQTTEHGTTDPESGVSGPVVSGQWSPQKLSEMPEEEQNAIWNLFSGVREKVASGAAQYRCRVWDMSTLMNQLFESYQLEGIAVPYTWEDFRRDYTREHLDLLTAEEILRRFSAEERLQGLSAEEVLRRFSAEEVLRRFSAEEVLRRFSADEIKAYLAKLEKPRKRRKP